jgi:hypothetical protein
MPVVDEGEQYLPAPQSASTRQFPFTHVLPRASVYGAPWQAQVWPPGQSVSPQHLS